MKLSDFDYPVPTEQIAKFPLKERDRSRLFVLHRESGEFEHRTFKDIVSYLKKGDLLVINNTKVIHARLYGTKPSGGKTEITLIKELEKNIWEGLVKGMSRGEIKLQKGITAHVSPIEGTIAKVSFNMGGSAGERDIKEMLPAIGEMPLPLYMKRDSVRSDHEQYQTVYAKEEGAIAAPTAGFHFTDPLMDSIRKNGVEVEQITLHIGYGTFKPVSAELISNHIMDEEYFEISEATARSINKAKEEERRVIAVGTTVTRALEASATEKGRVRAGSGRTSIFIFPGYKFRIINSLITNFHLPKSTPMMLASAFSGLDILKKAYNEAQKEGYRFYSYGDSMMII